MNIKTKLAERIASVTKLGLETCNLLAGDILREINPESYAPPPDEWALFIAEWFETFGNTHVTATQLLPIARKYFEFPFESERGEAHSLGRQLVKARLNSVSQNGAAIARCGKFTKGVRRWYLKKIS